MSSRSTAALILVAMLAACSHSSTTTSTTTTTDNSTASDNATTAAQSHNPCGVLSSADIAAVTHKGVDSSQATDDTHCTYTLKGGATNMIIVEANWTDADTQFAGGAAANKLMGDSGKAPKVGDASYSTAMGNLFYARKGNAYVGIDMRGASVPVETVGPELARRALAKM